MFRTKGNSGESRTHGRRRIGTVAAALAALALALGGCAGGGGGDDGGGVTDEPSPPFPSVVRYSAGSPADFSGSGVTITLDGGGTVRLGFFLEGSYAKGTRAYALEPHSVPRINVTTSGLPYTLLYDPFGLLVEQTVQWVQGSHPTAGQFRSVPAGTVRVTVTADAGGTGRPGVGIAWMNAGATLGTASLTWSELDGVLDDPSAWDPFVVQAAFEYQVIRWVFWQIQLGMDGIEFVTQHDADLTAAGDGVGIDHACDMLPFAGTAGNLHFTWNDGPGEFAGALGAGDDFTAAYDDCWVDEPGAAGVWLRSGSTDLLNHWEDPATITLGFDPMVLNDVVETATRQDGAAVGDTVTAGSFGLGGQAGFRLLTEPDTSAGINLTNVEDVASGAVASLLLPPDVGNLGLGLLAGLAADPAFDFCDIGGTVGVVPVPTASTPVPATFDVTFTACARDPADPATLDGTATLNVESVTGGTLAALATDDHAAALTVEAAAIDIADAVGNSGLTGGTRFERAVTAGDAAEASTSVPGGLTVEEAGVTRLLQSYSVASARAAGGAYTLGAAGDTMTVVSDALGGAVTITVLQPVQGTDPDAPASGALKIVALDGSNLTLTVVNGAVTLDLDTDGDGVVDDTLTADWIDLS
jgi:hypothetical protein